MVIASGMIANIGIENVVNLYNTDPAQAAPVWLAIDSVRDGIGGGNEIIGGVWILLVSWAALQTGRLSKALNYLGVVIGVAGILSAVPALGMFTDIFGLTQIVWFIWLGIVMLRKSKTSERCKYQTYSKCRINQVSIDNQLNVGEEIDQACCLILAIGVGPIVRGFDPDAFLNEDSFSKGAIRPTFRTK